MDFESLPFISRIMTNKNFLLIMTGDPSKYTQTQKLFIGNPRLFKCTLNIHKSTDIVSLLCQQLNVHALTIQLNT